MLERMRLVGVLLVIGGLSLAVGCTAPKNQAERALDQQQEEQAMVSISPIQVQTQTDTVSISNPDMPPQTPGPAVPVVMTAVSESAPGQASGGAPGLEQASPGAEGAGQELGTVSSEGWLTYVDAVYRFRILYPTYYVARNLSVGELSQLTPQPVAAIHFQDPRGDVAKIAPPAFSVRIFEYKVPQPIEQWLATTGLLKRGAGEVAEPYRGRHVSGVKVMSPNLMAPGWFVYVTDGTYIFQLTPLGTEAELMLDSFSFEK